MLNSILYIVNIYVIKVIKDINSKVYLMLYSDNVAGFFFFFFFNVAVLYTVVWESPGGYITFEILENKCLKLRDIPVVLGFLSWGSCHRNNRYIIIIVFILLLY